MFKCNNFTDAVLTDYAMKSLGEEHSAEEEVKPQTTKKKQKLENMRSTYDSQAPLPRPQAVKLHSCNAEAKQIYAQRKKE